MSANEEAAPEHARHTYDRETGNLTSLSYHLESSWCSLERTGGGRHVILIKQGVLYFQLARLQQHSITVHTNTHIHRNGTTHWQ